MSLPEIRDILFTADGLGGKPMPTDDDISALREENEELQEQVEKLQAERSQLVATKAIHDELHEILDLVSTDGTIYDLEWYKPDQMQSTLASVLCGLLHRLRKAETAIHETISGNTHLADGVDCTLRSLVEHVKEFPNQA